MKKKYIPAVIFAIVILASILISDRITKNSSPADASAVQNTPSTAYIDESNQVNRECSDKKIHLLNAEELFEHMLGSWKTFAFQYGGQIITFSQYENRNGKDSFILQYQMDLTFDSSGSVTMLRAAGKESGIFQANTGMVTVSIPDVGTLQIAFTKNGIAYFQTEDDLRIFLKKESSAELSDPSNNPSEEEKTQISQAAESKSFLKAVQSAETNKEIYEYLNGSTWDACGIIQDNEPIAFKEMTEEQLDAFEYVLVFYEFDGDYYAEAENNTDTKINCAYQIKKDRILLFEQTAQDLFATISVMPNGGLDMTFQNNPDLHILFREDEFGSGHSEKNIDHFKNDSIE